MVFQSTDDSASELLEEWFSPLHRYHRPVIHEPHTKLSARKSEIGQLALSIDNEDGGGYDEKVERWCLQISGRS